jgi:hypothetical protein
MLKRAFFAVISLLIVFSFCTSTILAQNNVGQGSAPSSSGITVEEDRMIPNSLPDAEEQKMIAPDYIMPPRGGGVMPFAGQNHNYSVVFRGNGESIVTLRVSLTNTSEKDRLSEVTLRLPKVSDPGDLSAYQIIAQGQCVRYGTPTYVGGTYIQPSCLEYGEPDYYYYYGGGKYQKAKTEFTGDTLKVTLPTPIAPSKTGSFFLYFRGFGYATKNIFGAYKYNFETLKVNDQINELHLGISTDADQVLKGVRGEVGYRGTEASVALKSAPAADAGAVANTTIDRFVQQIGQGQVVKTASNLAEMESYKVNGMYAKSMPRLYAKEISMAILIFLLLGVVIALLVKKFLGGGYGMGVKPVKVTASKDTTAPENRQNLMLSVGVSFSAAVLTAAYSVFVYFLSYSLQNYMSYQYSPISGILIVVISFAVYALVILGASALVGYKKGIGWGIATFVMTVGWIILFSIIAFLIIFMIGSNGNSYPPVMPMMRGATSVDSPAMEKSF